MITEFFQSYNSWKKANSLATGKIRTPRPPTLLTMMEPTLKDTSLNIAKQTGLDPYEVDDLITRSDFSNPILEEVLKELFTLLKLSYSGGQSRQRRAMISTENENARMMAAYQNKLSQYQEALAAREDAKNLNISETFKLFYSMKDQIADKVTLQYALNNEEQLVVEAISKILQFPITDHNSVIDLLSKDIAEEDVIRIMRCARNLLAQSHMAISNNASNTV